MAVWHVRCAETPANREDAEPVDTIGGGQTSGEAIEKGGESDAGADPRESRNQRVFVAAVNEFTKTTEVSGKRKGVKGHEG